MQHNLCIFGDSVASGIVSNPVTKRFELLKDGFVSLFSEAFGIPVKNYAKMGCTITKGEEIIEKKLSHIADCDTVVIEYGGNDSDLPWGDIDAAPAENHDNLTPYKQFVSLYEKIIAQFKSLGKQVILLTLPPIVPDRYFDWVSQGKSKENLLAFCGNSTHFLYRSQERYNIAIQNIAREMNTPLIDIRTEFLSQKHYENYMCIDGIHPNAEGHKLIFEFLKRLMGKPRYLK